MARTTSSTATSKQVLFMGNDASRLHELLSQAITPYRMDLVSQRALNAKLTALHVGGMAVYDVTYGTDVTVATVQPPEQYILRISSAGLGILNIAGTRIPFSPSIVSPGQAVTGRWYPDTRARFLCVPRRLVEGAVRAQLGDTSNAQVVFDARFDPERTEIREWLHLARHFHRMANSGLLARSPLAAMHFEQLIVHSLLAAQPHSLSEALLDARPRIVGHGPLRRAMAFCEENAGNPISVAEMAAAARMNVRTLQMHFQQRLGITPLGYLRRVRLAGAHADLRNIATGRAGGTVAQVANRWGFPQRRHFTALYQRAYGQRPSDTLRGADAPEFP